MYYYMQFNKAFPQRPNEESHTAWAPLFPAKLGFVQNPELAPSVASIAVYHELHCLVSIPMQTARIWHLERTHTQFFDVLCQPGTFVH
jgi:hypothetical protein